MKENNFLQNVNNITQSNGGCCGNTPWKASKFTGPHVISSRVKVSVRFRVSFRVMVRVIEKVP